MPHRRLEGRAKDRAVGGFAEPRGVLLDLFAHRRKGAEADREPDLAEREPATRRRAELAH